MEEIHPREKNFIVFKVAGALLFHVFGFMGFFFSVWKSNWNSAAWCLMLELCCTMVLVFNKNHVKGELHLKYSAKSFRFVKYFAMVLTICSFCAVIAYIAVGAMNKEIFDVKSHYAAAPIAFIAGIWYSVLFFDCRRYVYLLE